MRRAGPSGKIPFGFFNVWADHPNFMALVEEVWKEHHNSDPTKNVWYKLNTLRPLLKQLNNAEFRVAKEKQLLENLKKWSLIEENILQQKARAKWIRLGDANSKYFSAIMKERRQRKVITELVNAFGDRLTYDHQIQEEIITFYKSLMGSAATQLPAVNKQVMKNGPVLNHMHHIGLCAEVTAQEIYEGMCAIGDYKAPRVDGYNALFFLASTKSRNLSSN
ncbi:PREDICTED: uncharacterized protein LOC109207494 [Nicotiana attenuata]|uniref:uncharacterized protein LOC109207494 n=1 Tax=Nicotiana attenuata TaxID=49451 RepID=UPI000905D134|nr:PREDICTED: uncharacterized protein LOC109207494 [Nicotiana attenuata]